MIMQNELKTRLFFSYNSRPNRSSPVFCAHKKSNNHKHTATQYKSNKNNITYQIPQYLFTTVLRYFLY
jgi:hypothetical protein